jgi:hypothetical protein
MDDEGTANEEFLVLSDQEGNYFAIPRETVERYRISDEKQDELEKALGDDVMGYMQDNWYVQENRMAQYQSERRQEAARERMLQGAKESADAEDAGQGLTETQHTRLRGVLVGMFTVLRSFAPGSPK